MREDFWYESVGKGRLHGFRWLPEGEPRAVVQIVHGIAEFAERYDGFANYLNALGFLVVAEDHMGHGQSIGGGSTQGYFHGGWFAAVEDSYRLLRDTRAAFPQLPFFLFGHSMGSFMARTILCKYPDSGIAGALLCGTAWQNKVFLAAMGKLLKGIMARQDETAPNPKLERLVFGSYNRRVEHPKTAYDWISRDSKVVEAYMAHPLCGFIPSGGLMRDMMVGLGYIEQKKNLMAMDQNLPVFFLAGGDDPVGNYGEGVRKTAEAFRKAGMKNTKLRIYPLCRHELLNEINKEEIYKDIVDWMEGILSQGNEGSD